MPEPVVSRLRELGVSLFQTVAAQWVLILALIFGGCCSNALALELMTSQNPHAGTLLTFCQFLIVTLVSLPKQLVIKPPKPVIRKDLIEDVAQDILRTRSNLDPSLVLRVLVSKANGPSVPSLDLRLLSKRIGKSNNIIRVSAEDFALKRDEEEHTLARIRQELLEPLGPGGSRNYVTHIPEHGRLEKRYTIEPNSILLLDGVQFGRIIKQRHWEYSILLLQDRCSPKQRLLEKGVTTVITPFDKSPDKFIISHPSHRSSLWSRVGKLVRLRFKKLQIPLSVWLIQVFLFWVTSLLNNLALGFDVNLAVHIIFRSAGLCANMLLGWSVGKRYTKAQVLSVILITLGVASATLSSNRTRPPKISSHGSVSTGSYTIGILLLTIALILSAAMGLAQERAYNKYGKGHWQEALFYLHFLGLPMFTLVRGNLMDQFHAANSSPKTVLRADSLLMVVAPTLQRLLVLPTPLNQPIPSHIPETWLQYLIRTVYEKTILWLSVLPSITVPSFYIPLVLNVVTQFICVSGVHRLTSRVSSLTVTLVLAVRKAVSLWISVLVIKGSEGNAWLWGGAAAVFLGTITYGIDGSRRKVKKKEE
ncbi:golgi uridine diphosphate-N- acetylglucosamine transporter [Tulasnella sp. 419]|nr:golgi uridine diphosphate-N- acetylglucosamine transporter [Tulasnella sp. 419]